MNVGMVTSYSTNVSDSVSHVFRATAEALRQKHSIVYLPPEYAHSSKARQKELVRDMLLASDIILGPADDLILQARQDVDKHIPYACFLLGNMPRGASNMIRNYPLFRTTDVLIANCTADIELAHKFFNNAQVRLLPFAFNESFFYPLDEASKRAIKAKLRISSEEKVLLYSGRITVEKNVHTVLRIFSVVQKLIPKSRLIVVGNDDNTPFQEFGVFTLGIGSTLAKIITRLGMKKDKVSLVSQKAMSDLRDFYNIADVIVNMTLHHDENFGLSQVEAMACGTPVVGTNWGGLKDTIVDGETGYKISTVVSDSGVKANWWEALNKIVSILNNKSEYLQLRQRCRDSAYNRFSPSRYRQNLESILSDCEGKKERRGEALEVSEFARLFWALCGPQRGERPSYKRGVQPYQMYKDLIISYSGKLQCSAAADHQMKSNQVLCLATPLIQVNKRLFEVNDPIFPFEITLPDEHNEAIRTVIEAMKKEPAITVERLTREYLGGQVEISNAVEWMINAGLILNTGPEDGAISPRSIGSQMSMPLFSIQSVDYTTDVVVIR